MTVNFGKDGERTAVSLVRRVGATAAAVDGRGGCGPWRSAWLW